MTTGPQLAFGNKIPPNISCYTQPWLSEIYVIMKISPVIIKA